MAQGHPTSRRCVHSPAILPYSTAAGAHLPGAAVLSPVDRGATGMMIWARNRRGPSVYRVFTATLGISCPTCDRDNPVRFLDGGYAGESVVDESLLPAEGGTGSGLGLLSAARGQSLLPEAGAATPALSMAGPADSRVDRGPRARSLRRLCTNPALQGISRLNPPTSPYRRRIRASLASISSSGPIICDASHAEAEIARRGSRQRGR